MINKQQDSNIYLIPTLCNYSGHLDVFYEAKLKYSVGLLYLLHEDGALKRMNPAV